MIRELLYKSLENYDDPLISKDYLVDLFSSDLPVYQTLIKEFGFSNTKIAKFVKRNWPDKTSTNTFRSYLLSKLGYKFCAKCLQCKTIDEYNKNITNRDKLGSECRDCCANLRKDWYEANSQSHIQKVQSRKRKLDRALSYEEIAFIFDRDEHKCKQCGFSNENHLINFGQRLHLDHIKPSSKGGLTVIENMQLLCRSCNAAKKDTYIVCEEPTSVSMDQ